MFKELRYFVTAPVPHGFAWWGVADNRSTLMPKFEVAAMHKDMPNAEKEIRALAERLNVHESKQ